MSVSKVTVHPPRDFEAHSVEIGNGVIDVVPIVLGRHHYTTICHVVVTLTDGRKRAAKVEVNPTNGEMRIVRLDKKDVDENKAKGNVEATVPDKPPPPPADTPEKPVIKDPLKVNGGGK